MTREEIIARRRTAQIRYESKRSLDEVQRGEALFDVALCDAALQVEAMREELAQQKKLSEAISRDCNTTALERNDLRSQVEAMREVIKQNVALIRKHHSYRFTQWLEDVAADLSQSLNPKNEEGKS